MTPEQAANTIRDGWRDLRAALIAVNGHLNQPYPDDPRWTPWTRFVEPALGRMDADLAALKVLEDAAKEEARISEMRRVEGSRILDERNAAVARAEAAEARVRQLEDGLEGVEVFYAEALGLIRELLDDAQRLYEPEKGWPPHIEKARHLGDHEETLTAVRALLAGEQEEKPGTLWFCTIHGNDRVSVGYPRGTCPDADRGACVWQPSSRAAGEQEEAAAAGETAEPPPWKTLHDGVLDEATRRRAAGSADGGTG